MSVRVESPPVHGSFNRAFAIAIIVALGIGIFAGTVITKAVDAGSAVVATPVTSQVWDAQKLQAMQGRALAERYRAEPPLAWDAQKLEAMSGRVLYRPLVIQPEVAMTAKPSGTLKQPENVGWDEQKLAAMAGRVLAAQVGAEDPPVKPHLPKRPPNG